MTKMLTIPAEVPENWCAVMGTGRRWETQGARWIHGGGGVQSLNWVWVFMAAWTIPQWAPLSMGFFRHEYWSGLPWQSRASSQPRDGAQVSCIGRWSLYCQATSEAKANVHASSSYNLWLGPVCDRQGRGSLLWMKRLNLPEDNWLAQRPPIPYAPANSGGT